MSQTLQIILAVVPIIGGFLFWHFKTVNGFKDQINDLKIQMKELENRDNLQQQTLDQLKDLFPILKATFEHIQNKKQTKK